MEYSINKLAKLAGISRRTLHYYDEIKLLCPRRKSSNGYRIYGQEEIDRLQQILFYRELGVGLEEISRILSSPSFDTVRALHSHLAALMAKRQQLEMLIDTVQKTILTMKGEINMSDKEKFQGFKEKLVEDNELKYGEEIRAKYGDDRVDRSNAKLKSMSEEEYAQVEALRLGYEEALREAAAQGDPASPLAQKACALHKEWLCFYWDTYSKEAHIGLTQMYVEDPRFSAYYDNIRPGSGGFLRDAVLIYCS